MINRLLSKTEENPSQHHSEHLEKQAALLLSMLNKTDIKDIISLAYQEPDFLEIFGETEDQVNNQRYATEARIDYLMIRASREISERKAATLSGFKKLAYPQFNGEGLNYLEFKKRWTALELVALWDSIPATAKAKLTDVHQWTRPGSCLMLSMENSKN